MSIFEEIEKAFMPVSSSTINEKYTTLDFEYNVQVSSLSTLVEQDIQDFFLSLKSGTIHDSWLLSISDGGNDSLILDSSAKEVSEFFSNLRDLVDFTEFDLLNLKLHIEKEHSSGIINIYSLDSFTHFIDGLSAIQFLNVINDDLLRENILSFRILDKISVDFFSRNLHFKNSISRQNVDNSYFFESKSREVCYFSSQAKYPYSPRFFSPIEKGGIPDAIFNKLRKLSFIFSITNIFDVTSIEGNSLSYKLNGYKSLEGTIDIDSEIDANSINTYFDIYDWIYSNSSNISEKIGISRNILSIYLQENSLSIEKNAFYSIQSGFRIYLQENLNRYLEIRATINEQLININQSANNSIEKYLDDYQKSSITFVSFFISTLVITVLSNGQFQNVFTKDATILALALIAISLLYLVFSRWNLYSEKERLKIRYNNLKGRFRDLLIEEDIEKILQENQEFEDEIKFIESRSNVYTLLWIGTVLIILIAILSLSSYINWNTFIDFLKSIF
jgi:hypothetical protein